MHNIPPKNLSEVRRNYLKVLGGLVQFIRKNAYPLILAGCVVLVLLVTLVVVWGWQTFDQTIAGVELTNANLVDPVIAKSIQKGVASRLVYLDDYYGSEPADLSIFNKTGVRAYVSYKSFVENQENLFNCGLLLMNYAMYQREMPAEELMVVKKFIANGGRVLLLCPGWVWVSYEKKDLKRLPYNQIANEFGLKITDVYAERPFRIVDQKWYVKDIADDFPGVFSSIDYEDAIAVVVGKDDKAACVAAQKGNARIIVWGQNNLLTEEFSFSEKGLKFITKVFNWLFLSSRR